MWVGLSMAHFWFVLQSGQPAYKIRKTAEGHWSPLCVGRSYFIHGSAISEDEYILNNETT